MKIDIISYTDAQYATLTHEQLLQVKSAQLKKNRLLLKLEEDMQAEKNRLLKNGVFLSRIWELYCKKLTEEYNVEVENIRDSLLFYLRFSVKPDDAQTNSVPYVVDYSLTMEERFHIVKNYYEATYEDGGERFATFKKDAVAVSYLGELYAPLYDYFLEFA